MTAAQKLIEWLSAGTPPRWQSIAIVLALMTPGILVSLANALTKHYSEKTGIIRALYFLADLFSVLASKGSPVTLKMPGTVSPPPGSEPPTFPPGGGLGGAS